MYSSDISRNDYFQEHCVPQHKGTAYEPSFTGINYPEYPSEVTGYQQTPLNIFNNYNPNFHHHHYYYPNFQDYGYQNDQNWIKRYDCDSQKDYYSATSSSSIDFCEFEVPQHATKPSDKSVTTEIDKFYSDNLVSSSKSHKELTNNNYMESFESFELWNSDKKPLKCLNLKSQEKLVKKCTSTKSDEKEVNGSVDESCLGEKSFRFFLMELLPC